MQNRWGQVTEEDYKIIANQLGREPRGVLGVALRCEYGYPQVIVNRPIIGQMEEVTVFPTSLWLTCPYLCKLISKLESIGLIGTLQMRIANDQELAELVKRDHEAHAQFRTSLVPDEVLQSLSRKYPNEYQVIITTGVGGTRSPDGVKCLHAHFADYLVTGTNQIGAVVYDLLGAELNCPSEDCRLEN
ncbi:MAG: DUF501 domain-containing protein [Firmicutes bacterium]|jgi:hypothetical protein|nr:DUF501 domain-containing protein [Bacillota bacterium]NLL88270.1 DUF501 domain-containing protein [Bacillota bacterium]HKM18356.1 DUF501 domain-containing protein [Limnochordia bacterium]